MLLFLKYTVNPGYKRIQDSRKNSVYKELDSLINSFYSEEEIATDFPFLSVFYVEGY